MHRRLVLAAALVAALSASCTRTQPALPTAETPALPDLAHQLAGRDLRRDPLRVEAASLDVIDSSEGLLQVTFAEGDRLPSSLSIQVDGTVATLRDDGKEGDAKAGDRVLSGKVPIDIIALEKRQETLAAMTGKPIPVFHGRQKLEDIVLRNPAAAALRPGSVIDLKPKVPDGNPANINASQSLMINDPGVTQDPSRTRTNCSAGSMGKWSFGYLMEQMANTSLTGVSPSDLALRWLQRWKFGQVVNDWPVAARPNIQSLIIDPWQQASGGSGSPLDLSKAPFRLLAIVNRVDLRENLIYGGGSAGEARFVFGALDQSCNPLPFTVIFEYGIAKKNCTDLKAWAQQWKDLDHNPIGSAAYNQALEAITEQFVVSNAAPAKPNGSALNQLRTNEIALAPEWELREFQLTSSSAGNLDLVTVKQTPDISLNDTSALADYVNTDETPILGGTYRVPLQFPPGARFLGGSSPTPFFMFWDKKTTPGSIINSRDARQGFSLGTCNACHAGETQTTFTHVSPAGFGPQAADLSGFLTGITVNDPADGTPVRTFNDLDRRAQDLDALVNSQCFSLIGFKPLLMVH